MIKTLIFDLDGVLVDTKKIHFEALNYSLKKIEKFAITFLDHSKTFDGLPTDKKLDILLKKKKIKKKNLDKIKYLKKIETKKLIKKHISYSSKTFNLFKKLKKRYKIAIATNAINKTLVECIKILKLEKFIDYSISNENVNYPKPHPEIYLKCLVKLNSKPSETMIIEDSHYGRTAALESGCKLFPVKKLNDVNLKNINNYVKILNMDSKKNVPWIDNKLNVVIPMAGKGSRFADAGYTFPKPLIEVGKKPMIEIVLDSLNISANYIFLVQKEHQKKYNIKSLLNTLKPNCKIVEIDKVTQGAACTVLLAKKYINNNNPLIISNSDQYIEWNSSKTMYEFTNKNFDGGILFFKAFHPKWSYAKIDKITNLVTEVAEKKVISENATVGVYYWKKGSDYVKYANQMIKKNIRVNNEFYVCPVFNQAIKDKKKIALSEVDKMYGLGTPEDLKFFEKKNNL